jgi:hypothetical protein
LMASCRLRDILAGQTIMIDILATLKAVGLHTVRGITQADPAVIGLVVIVQTDAALSQGEAHKVIAQGAAWREVQRLAGKI